MASQHSQQHRPPVVEPPVGVVVVWAKAVQA
jgi:hypothetical protein